MALAGVTNRLVHSTLDPRQSRSDSTCRNGLKVCHTNRLSLQSQGKAVFFRLVDETAVLLNCFLSTEITLSTETLPMWRQIRIAILVCLVLILGIVVSEWFGELAIAIRDRASG